MTPPDKSMVEPSGRSVPGLAEQLAELARDAAAMPDIDQRSADDMLGIDATGLWT